MPVLLDNGSGLAFTHSQHSFTLSSHCQPLLLACHRESAKWGANGALYLHCAMRVYRQQIICFHCKQHGDKIIKAANKN